MARKRHFLLIFSYVAVVRDTDGSAFITKAEFDSLKNNFQAQIDNYNSSIDSKIDGAIAAYLAGIALASEIELENIYKSYTISTKGSGSGMGLTWSSKRSGTYSIGEVKPEYIGSVTILGLDCINADCGGSTIFLKLDDASDKTDFGAQAPAVAKYNASLTKDTNGELYIESIDHWVPTITITSYAIGVHGNENGPCPFNNYERNKTFQELIIKRSMGQIFFHNYVYSRRPALTTSEYSDEYQNGKNYTGTKKTFCSLTPLGTEITIDCVDESQSITWTTRSTGSSDPQYWAKKQSGGGDFISLLEKACGKKVRVITGAGEDLYIYNYSTTTGHQFLLSGDQQAWNNVESGAGNKIYMFCQHMITTWQKIKGTYTSIVASQAKYLDFTKINNQNQSINKGVVITKIEKDGEICVEGTASHEGTLVLYDDNIADIKWGGTSNADYGGRSSEYTSAEHTNKVWKNANKARVTAGSFKLYYTPRNVTKTGDLLFGLFIPDDPSVEAILNINNITEKLAN